MLGLEPRTSRRYDSFHRVGDRREGVTLNRSAARSSVVLAAPVSARTSDPIYGYVYDVRSGRLDEVKPATEAGRALA